MALFTIYASSAGSGKTYTLTREYLRIALGQKEPDYFRRILAMTFTNDATEEMKRRIIGTLKVLRADPSTPSPLREELLKELHFLSPEELQSRADQLLHLILQDYNDLAVKTIDSFINQIISAFTFDLQLPYNYEIVLDTKEIIAEAVHRMIDRVGDDPELTNMFKDFALAKVDEKQGWNNLQNDIVAFAEVIYKDNNAEIIAKNIGLSHQDALEIRDKIWNSLRHMEGEVQALAHQALELIHQHGLSAEDFWQGGRGVYGYLKKLHESPEKLWTEASINAYAQRTLAEGKWKKDKGPQTHLVEAIQHHLQVFLSQIIAKRSDKYTVLSTVQKSLLLIPFLAAVKREVDTLLAETNRAVLADFNRKILDIVREEYIPYIYERIGERYNHLLVDEFQDTSDMQFFNLLPLFDNAIAKHGENLIVGDPKQAIYSWRGGNVLLMLELMNSQRNYFQNQLPPFQMERISTLKRATAQKNLTINYRSAEDLIAFNNCFFTTLIEKQNNPMVTEVFQDYIQQAPPKPLQGGYTALEVLTEKSVDEGEKIRAWVAELIADGYELADICILCRRQKEVQNVALFLQEGGYAIQSSEALKVNNNREVQFLVAALRFALHSDRKFERFTFLQFFFLVKNVDQARFDLHQVCSATLDQFLAFFSHLGYDLTGMKGLDPYQLAEFFTAKFGLLQVKSSSAYLLAFLDHTLDFTLKQSKNLSDLLRNWEISKDKLAIPPTASNAVTVTTIHKSKGLEYPVVLLPYINWDIEPKPSSPIWLSLEALDYPELEYVGGRLLAAPFSLGKTFAEAAPLVSQERDTYLIESLNLLYVAMTRAKERQYLWAWKSSGIDAKWKGIATFFGQYLDANRNTAEPPTLQSYEYGQKKQKIQQRMPEEQPSYLMEFPRIFEGNTGPKIKWNAPEDDVREGNLIHSLFEHILTPNDLEPALERCLRQGSIQQGKMDGLRSKIRAVMEHPTLAPLFTPEAKVRTEATILSSQTQIRRPDRVIAYRNKVYVVDYKTGRKRNTHQKQLQEYAILLRQMGIGEIVPILVYLDPLEVVQVSL